MQAERGERLKSLRTYIEELKLTGSIKITLYTCGIEDLYSKNSNVRRVLKWDDAYADPLIMDIAMDATVFKVAPSVDVGQCTGEHVDVLRAICEDTEKLDKLFLEFQYELWLEFEARDRGIKHGSIGIAIFSYLGRHRSRAMARLLDYILFRIGGFTVEDQIHHLSSGDCGWWDCPHGCCWPGGATSGAASREKIDLLDQAYRRYINLQNSQCGHQWMRKGGI